MYLTAYNDFGNGNSLLGINWFIIPVPKFFASCEENAHCVVGKDFFSST